MTRINFYIIKESSTEQVDAFICRLTEKICSQNNAIYIHTMNEQHAIKFDELLWSFKEDSFIPHQLAGAENNKQAVLIGHQSTAEIPATHHNVLINLDDEIPSFFSQFERVAEIISGDEDCRIKGRKRYQFYRDRGYALETHEISL